MKIYAKLFAVAITLISSFNLKADSFFDQPNSDTNYNFVTLQYSTLLAEPSNSNTPDEVGFFASYNVKDDFAIAAIFSTGSESGSNYDVETTNIGVRATYHQKLPFFQNIDFFQGMDARIFSQILRVSLEVDYNRNNFFLNQFSFSDTETVIFVGAGLKKSFTDELDVYVDLNLNTYDQVGNETIQAHISGTYKFADNFHVESSIILNRIFDFDYIPFNIGLRYDF
jgi:hypothetical protein